MTKLVVLVATVVAGLALAGLAQAGCMATVGLDSMPKAGLRPGSRGSSRSVCSSTAARRCPTRSRRLGSATPPASSSSSRRRRPQSRLVPRPRRLPEGRPLLARRLRRLPGQGVREGAHLQVRGDRLGLRLCCGAGLPAGAARSSQHDPVAVLAAGPDVERDLLAARSRRGHGRRVGRSCANRGECRKDE